MSGRWGEPSTQGRGEGERTARTVSFAGAAAGGALTARAGTNKLRDLNAERDRVVRTNIGRVQQARTAERAAGYQRSVAVRRVKAATRQQRRLDRWDDSQDLRPLRVREPGRRGATTLDQLGTRRSERYFLSSRLRSATERAAAAAPPAMAEHTRATSALRSATTRAKQEIGGLKAAQGGAYRRARLVARTGRGIALAGAVGAAGSAWDNERKRSR